MPSCARPPRPRRADRRPTVSRTKPTSPKMTRLVTAQCGIFAVSSDPRDEQRDREEVEQPVREDGAEQRRARSLAVREVAAQHRDAGELAGPRRQHRVPEQPDPEGGEHLAETRRGGSGSAWSIVSAPRQRAREDGEEVEQDADDHPAPARRSRTRGRRCSSPARATRCASDRAGERGEHEEAARPGVAGERRRAGSRGTPRARGRSSDPLVDPLEPAGDVAPRVAARARSAVPPRPSRRGAARRRAAPSTASTSADGSSGRRPRRRSRVSRPRGTPGCPTRRRAARRRTRASAPSRSSRRRATARRAPSSSGAGRQLLLRQEAEDVDAGVGNREPGEQEPHGERVGAGDD